MHARPTRSPSAAAQRQRQINELLDARAKAVLTHDEAAFVATLDPRDAKLIAQQRREFNAVQAVPLASWSYEVEGPDARSKDPQLAKYDEPVSAPAEVLLRYAIKGFDRAPATLREQPTFVKTADGWRIASYDDFGPSDTDIWDFGAIRTARAPRVLVLGHPTSKALMRQVADETAAAIPLVTKVWGSGWAERAVVLVPSTQRELARIVDDNGDLSQIAAVTSAEVQDCPGPPNPVGSRVGINPRNWGRLSALGRRVVLVHELTHVATRAVTGSCMPTWLVEGFADYVGYLDTGIPVRVVAQELATDVQAGRVPRNLPADKDFRGDSGRLSQAYEGGWMAARLVASRWSQATLVRLYRAVGESSASPSVALADGVQSVLHVSMSRFVSLWRAYLRSELG